MKVAILFAAFLATFAMADTETQASQAEEKGCPRQAGECNREQPLRPRPRPDEQCREQFGPCECPKGYALVGSKFDSTSFQTWECRKYTKNCDVECSLSGKGFLGFCLSDITIEREFCRVPDCFFDEKSIYSSAGFTLNRDKDGFFVLETSRSIRNFDCNLCCDGKPVCLKRIPYFEFFGFPSSPVV